MASLLIYFNLLRMSKEYKLGMYVLISVEKHCFTSYSVKS